MSQYTSQATFIFSTTNQIHNQPQQQTKFTIGSNQETSTNLRVQKIQHFTEGAERIY